jgi:hypothetical protein
MNHSTLNNPVYPGGVSTILALRPVFIEKRLHNVDFMVFEFSHLPPSVHFPVLLSSSATISGHNWYIPYIRQQVFCS